MFLWKPKQKIAMFGIGKIGKMAYYKYRFLYDIVAFIDNNIESDSDLYGIKVYKYSEFIKSFKEMDCKILVTSKQYWKEMCDQLSESGLEIYDDYIPYCFLEYNEIDFYNLSTIVPNRKMNYVLEKMRKEKKVAIIYGNCQADGIRRYMVKNEEFSKKYILYTIPAIWDVEKLEEIIDNENLWNKCSLLITQNIRNENSFGVDFSVNSIINRLKCMSKVKYQIVTIMNMKFNGYFPQCIDNPIVGMRDIDWEGIQCRDKNIIKMINEEGIKTTDEILKTIGDQEFYSYEYMEKYIKDEFDRLRNMEKQCDVIISDYIYNNFTKEVLFYCQYHPNIKVVKEYARRILKYLDVQNMDFEKEGSTDEWLTRYPYNHICELIYPSVVKALGLPESVNNKLYYLNNKIFSIPMNFREVVYSYATVCIGKNDETCTMSGGFITE
jgi:hypothetical protein